jgi:hypothetical protein
LKIMLTSPHLGHLDTDAPKNSSSGVCQWLTSVNPTTWKTEQEDLVQGQPRQKSSRDSISMEKSACHPRNGGKLKIEVLQRRPPRQKARPYLQNNQSKGSSNKQSSNSRPPALWTQKPWVQTLEQWESKF